MDDIDTCKVCLENYSDDIRPHALGCGHSFCMKCLKDLAARNNYSCPKCKRTYSAKNFSKFPVNYDLEEMISKFRESKVKAPRLPRTVSSKVQIFLEEQIESSRNLLQITLETKAQLIKYRDLVLERKVQHRELLPKIYELASWNEDAVSEIEREHARLTDAEGEVEALTEELNANLKQLETEYSILNADDLDKSYVALEYWNMNCQLDISEAAALNSSSQLLKTTQAALKALEAENACDKSEASDLERLLSSSLDSLNSINNGSHDFSVEKLLKSSVPMKELLDRNVVYAVCEEKGSKRYAKVSLQNSNIYLHHLKDGESPTSSYTLKQSELIGTLASNAVTAFLDLAWDGITQGRVHILLHSNTPLANQFRILCTGDQGPTYANCQLLEVAYKGEPTSQGLRFGDYEFNNGKGGAALVTGINLKDEQYRRPHEAGIVWASFDVDDGPQATQFTITTGTYPKNYYNRVFGLVQDGMDVLTAAAEVDNISGVKIVDCGVVLPRNS